MDIKVIFEDSDLLVLDKPAGMIVNKADTTKDKVTVQDFVEDYLRVPRGVRVSQVPQGDVATSDTRGTLISPRDTFKARAGVVHRLDKETSGILLVAKTLPAFVNLQAQFKERKVEKTYIALAHGKIEPQEGEINVSVGRLPWNRKRFGVLADGRESVTRYRVILNFILSKAEGQISNSQQDLTLVELTPKTGRTHQIRVHLQYIKHPIFSDPLYAGRKTSRNDRKLLPRIFLHASKISFFHPRTNEVSNFESPLPRDLSKFLESPGS